MSVLLCHSQFQLTSLTRTVEYQLSFNVMFKFSDVMSMERVCNISV